MSRSFTLPFLRSRFVHRRGRPLRFTSHVAAQAPVRIMPLGDSITAGPGCWRAYLWNQLQTAGYSNIDFVGGVNDGGGCNPGFAYDFNHEGHSGFSITGIADANQLPPWLTAARPQHHRHAPRHQRHVGRVDTARNQDHRVDQAHRPDAGEQPEHPHRHGADHPDEPGRLHHLRFGCRGVQQRLGPLAASLNTAQSPIYVVDQWTGFDLATDTYDAVHPLTSGFIKMANRFFPAVHRR